MIFYICHNVHWLLHIMTITNIPVYVFTAICLVLVNSKILRNHIANINCEMMTKNYVMKKN